MEPFGTLYLLKSTYIDLFVVFVVYLRVSLTLIALIDLMNLVNTSSTPRTSNKKRTPSTSSRQSKADNCRARFIAACDLGKKKGCNPSHSPKTFNEGLSFLVRVALSSHWAATTFVAAAVLARFAVFNDASDYQSNDPCKDDQYNCGSHLSSPLAFLPACRR